MDALGRWLVDLARRLSSGGEKLGDIKTECPCFSAGHALGMGVGVAKDPVARRSIKRARPPKLGKKRTEKRRCS